MNELIGKKIIRWDDERNGVGDLLAVTFILDDGKRVRFEVVGTGSFDSELEITID